jgi:superfamily II DNA or RNA helicase
MENMDKRFLVLTPSRFIISEIRKHISKPEHVSFMTYLKAMLLAKSEIKRLKPDYIILDEFHRCGAEEWSSGVDVLLKNYPDVRILGTTATPIRYLDGARNMAEEIFENQIAQNLTLAKAIVTRILPSPRYVSALYTFDEDYF